MFYKKGKKEIDEAKLLLRRSRFSGYCKGIGEKETPLMPDINLPNPFILILQKSAKQNREGPHGMRLKVTTTPQVGRWPGGQVDRKILSPYKPMDNTNLKVTQVTN